MKIPTLLTGVLLGAAAVPTAQITQQAIIKVSGNIDLRSPISVDAMPPLSFKTLPVETIEIDETVGFYQVPAGKVFRVVYVGMGFGNNETDPSYVPVDETFVPLPAPPFTFPYKSSPNTVRVTSTTLPIDPGALVGTPPTSAGPNAQDGLFWPEGTTFEWEDWELNSVVADPLYAIPDHVSTNGYPYRKVLRGELRDA